MTDAIRNKTLKVSSNSSGDGESESAEWCDGVLSCVFLKYAAGAGAGIELEIILKTGLEEYTIASLTGKTDQLVQPTISQIDETGTEIGRVPASGKFKPKISISSAGASVNNAVVATFVFA